MYSLIVFIRYFIGGGLALTIHLVVLAILVESFRFNPTVGTSVGFCVATIFNYSFQYHLTFRAKGSHAKVFLRYLIVTVLMMGLNAALFWCLTEIWQAPYIYAQMLATAVIMFCNFAINRHYTFNYARTEGVILNTIKNQLLSQKILQILILAFVLRLIVFLLFRPWDIHVQADEILTGDSPGYHRLAQCIVNDFSFCADTFRTPGYPFFIAIFYSLFGAKPWVVLFAQILVSLVSIYYVFKIGEILFSKRVGMVAALLLAIDPNTIFSTASLYSESLFVAFLSASFYFYLRGLTQGEWRSFVFAGMLLAITTLVRPVAQYYFIILFFAALLWPTGKLSVRLKWGLLYALAFAVITGPWLYRNYTLYDTVKLSSIQGENLLFWQVAYARSWETHQPYETINAELVAQAKTLGYSESGNPFVNERIAQKIAIEYIKTHPRIYLSRWISGTIHTYTNLSTADIVTKLGLQPGELPKGAMFASESEFELIANFFRLKSFPEIASGFIVMALLLVNYSTFLLGASALIRQHQLATFTLFVISIMYFTVTGGPIGLARFRLPVEPFYLLVGAFYIDLFLNKRLAKNQPVF